MTTSYIPAGLPPLTVPGTGSGSIPYVATLPYGAPLFGTQQQQQRLKKPQLHPTVVVLTNVPSFLSHSRNLRDWVYSVGAHAKSISYSRDNRSNEYQNASTRLYLKHKIASSNTTATTTTESTDDRNNTVAVIRMSHSTGAYHVCRLWEQAKHHLAESSLSSDAACETPEMNAYLLVTTSNDQYLPADPLNKEHDREYLDTFVFPNIYGETMASTTSFVTAAPPSASLPTVSMPVPSLTTSANLVPSSFINPPILPVSNVESAISDMPSITPSPDHVEETLVTRLIEAYHTIRLKQENMDATAIQGGIDPTTLSDNILVSSTDLDFKETEDPASSSSSRLDVQKVAAAAGGGQYDEDMDPLNAPAVLEAVAKFKRTLEETSTIVKKKRLDYVDKKIQEFLGPARQRLEQRRQSELEEEERRKKVAEEEHLRSMALAAGLPLPPPPMMKLPPPLPPLPTEGIPTGLADSGRRGISNLPSWMTKTPPNSVADGAPAEDDTRKRNMYSDSQDIDPTQTRKPRLDMDSSLTSMALIRAENEAVDAAYANQNISDDDILNPTSLFPPLLQQEVPTVRTFVKEQIIKYLGEEEPSMIDFVMSHLQSAHSDERTTGALLNEFSLVLENDSQLFVVNLFRLLLSQYNH